MPTKGLEGGSVQPPVDLFNGRRQVEWGYHGLDEPACRVLGVGCGAHPAEERLVARHEEAIEQLPAIAVSEPAEDAERRPGALDLTHHRAAALTRLGPPSSWGEARR